MIREENPKNAWPPVKKLADQFIPPFVQDAVWTSRGRPEWTYRSTEEEDGESVCLYLGKTSDPEISGSFLLIVYSHEHAEVNHIWYKNTPNVEMPKLATPDSFARSGWLQVVPYLGEEELRRLKGDKSGK
jgi:hypothetical protein